MHQTRLGVVVSFMITTVLLAAHVRIAYSQDFPPSVGPAPMVYNYDRESIVFITDHPGHNVFTYNNTSLTNSQLRKQDIGTPGTATNVGPTNGNFWGGTDFGGPTGILYGVHSASAGQGTLYSIDTTTGAITLIGNCTGLLSGHNFTGLAWDCTNNTMYGVSTNISVTQLYSVNLTTGALTPIGTAQATAPALIGIASNPAGSLFGYDIVNDNCFRIDKTTGTPTLIHALGFNANFGQGCDIDPFTGQWYLGAYNSSGGPQQWICDTAGASPCTNQGAFSGALQITGYAIPPGCVGAGALSTLCRNGLNKPISDNQLTLDTINVNIGNANMILDIDVKIDTVIHTADGDLIFRLGHLTQGVTLINRRGLVGQNFIGTILDDAGVVPIAAGVAPFTGTFTPEDSLSRFNGTAVNGLYILSIRDTLTLNTGTLRAWCITIRYSTLLGGIETVTIPSRYALKQNYPNPFNPSTKITYQMPNAGYIRLTVYDISGKEIITLVNGFKAPGVYDAEFNGQDLPSGVYFYRLESNEFTDTKKMVLIK